MSNNRYSNDRKNGSKARKKGNQRIAADVRMRQPVGPVGGSNRDSVATLAAAILAIILIVATFLLTVVDIYDAQDRSVDRRTRTDAVLAKRGTIYDRNGNILAMSVECTVITANPRDVNDPEAASEELASILGGKAEDYYKLLTKDTGFVYIDRQADVSLANKLKDRKAALNEAAATQYEAEREKAEEEASNKGEEFDVETFYVDPNNKYHDYRYYLNALYGISFEDSMKRVYPYGRVGGQVIGYVGVDGDGLTGLELYYDDILSGTDGVKTAQYGIGGVEIPGTVTENVSAVDGTDITVSIDITFQQYCEDQLAEQVKAGNAISGNIMVIDGATGEIYATASTPFYDLSDVSKSEEGASTLKSISEVYEPGSIFKSVTTSVLLEENKVNLSETFDIDWQLEYYDRIIKDATEHDKEKWTIAEILEQSSNVGMTILEQRLDKEVFYGYLVKYGFGAKTGVDFPGEAEGILNSPSKWDLVTEANISFGQGVSTSTIQMATFYAALANGGIRCTPHFLIGYPHSEQTVSYDSERIISNQTVSTLTGLLIGVVENGTGKDAAVSGYDIAGKTGTGQKLKDNGEYSQFSNWIDFAGYFANTNSAITCVVALDDPWGSYAKPVFKKVMEYAAERYVVVSHN